MKKYLIAVGLILAANVQGAEVKRTTGPWYLVVSSSPQYPSNPTYEDCIKMKDARIASDAKTRTKGSLTYYCREATNVTFGPSPLPPTCTVAKPVAETRVQQCQAPLVGSFGQTREYVAAPYPTCWVQGTVWAPEVAPTGVCQEPVPEPPTNVAVLSWTPPTQNTDGSPLTNLAGTNVYYGRGATTLTQSVQVPGAGTSKYTVYGLAPGLWYFGVRAYNTQLSESALSSVVSKEIK